MSRQKKFSSMFEIQAEIIKAKNRIVKIKKEAQELDNQALAYLLEANKPDVKTEAPESGVTRNKTWLLDQHKFVKDKASKLWNRASSIENVTLVRLKNTMAALQTEVMPFMEGDKSTVLAEAK